MFVKSTRFKQVCQLLLSLIVDTAYIRRVPFLANLLNRPGSREKIICSGLLGCTSELKQFAKKVVSDIRGLVGFANAC